MRDAVTFKRCQVGRSLRTRVATLVSKSVTATAATLPCGTLIATRIRRAGGRLHPSAHAQMALSIERYMEKGRRYDVLDFGSGTSPNQTMTHRSILEGYEVAYTGVDVREGDNIDTVMPKPYKIPLKSRSIDVVLSGQVFEHVPFFWASLLEIARVMRPRALLLMTVPSRG